MENASKALIMAASVLIAIMVLTLAVYLFTSFSGRANDMKQQQAEEQLNQFNTQFIQYQNRNDVTIYEVISVAQLATEINKTYDLRKNEDDDQGSYYVKVKLKNDYIEYGAETNNNEEIQKKYSDLIKKDIENMGSQGNLPIYICTVNINQVTNRVNEVIFSPK